MKRLLVASHGILQLVVSVFGTKTLNVQQFPSNFSTRNIVEQFSEGFKPVVVEHTSIKSLHTGIEKGMPFPQQVNN